MTGKCTHIPCKFIHDKKLCREFYKDNTCKFGEKCRFNHCLTLQKQVIVDLNNIKPEEKPEKNVDKKPSPPKKNKSKYSKEGRMLIKRNTINFEPDYRVADMRVLFEYGKQKCELELQNNDVAVFPDLFINDVDLYDKLLKEVYATEFDKEKLIIPWHEKAHVIVDDHLNWKPQCPTFNYIVKKIADYFEMDIKASRMNWMRDYKEHKHQHHDSAAVKADKAKTQNFTVGISFGATRDIRFEVANFKDCRNTVSFPLTNGTTYCFGKDVNVNWRHGVPPVKTSEPYEPKKEDGRISIIAWGYRKLVEV
jgi:hypothetical protein